MLDYTKNIKELWMYVNLVDKGNFTHSLFPSIWKTGRFLQDPSWTATVSMIFNGDFMHVYSSRLTIIWSRRLSTMPGDSQQCPVAAATRTVPCRIGRNMKEPWNRGFVCPEMPFWNGTGPLGNLHSQLNRSFFWETSQWPLSRWLASTCNKINKINQ